MSWTQPRTWVAGEVPSASTINTHIRDNLRAMVWEHEFLATSETRNAGVSGTGYGNLTTTGPDLALATNTEAMVFIGCDMFNDTAGHHCIMSFDVSGTTTRAANDNEMFDYESSVVNQRCAGGRMNKVTGLTAGANNVFTAKYRVTGGIGTFLRRRIMVLAMGPA